MQIIYLCIKIFFVRIIDVSLGTMRMLLTVKDKKLLSSIIGFIEVFIWFIIVKDALNNNSNGIIIGIFYALGFAIGTYLGGVLSKIFTTNNTITIQVIIPEKNNNIIDILRREGYAVSVLSVKGYKNINRLLLFIEIKFNSLNKVRRIINSIDDSAFIVVNDSKMVYNGYFSSTIK